MALCLLERCRHERERLMERSGIIESGMTQGGMPHKVLEPV